MQAILVINAGSSSIKFAVYGADDLRLIARGLIDDIGDDCHFRVRKSPDDAFARAEGFPARGGHDDLVAWLLDHLAASLAGITIAAVGHRVVHGGREFAGPCLISPDVIERLRSLAPLAPGHQPHNLAGIEAVARRWPDTPQVACFDTAFHRTMPDLAQLYAIPRRMSDAGVIRYGFHGLSYAYIASILPTLAGERATGRVIVAHLGHGASLCAMKDLSSQATTMGFTALDGLMMGKRCGDIDPGVVIDMIARQGLSADEASTILRRRSGLLGVSGISSDMRDLMAAGTPEARQAIDLFIYRVIENIGAFAAILGGLDVLVFTAGIGENSSEIRRAICAPLAWLGVELDDAANAANDDVISTPASKVLTLRVHTREALVVARAARDLLALGEAKA